MLSHGVLAVPWLTIQECMPGYPGSYSGLEQTLREAGTLVGGLCSQYSIRSYVTTLDNNVRIKIQCMYLRSFSLRLKCSKCHLVKGLVGFGPFSQQQRLTRQETLHGLLSMAWEGYLRGGQGFNRGDWHVICDKIKGTKKN